MTRAAHTLIVGDIGGTNARFALARLRDGGVNIDQVWKRPARDFSTFQAALDAFRRGVAERPDGAAFGVAGPVIHERAELTNGSWIIDAAVAAGQLDGVPVLLANDFETMARSAPDLDSEALQELSEGSADPDGALAIVGPGTGLGVGALRRIRGGGEGGWIVVGGEGGHQAFSPQSELEWRVFEILHSRLGYVSNEVVASGSGLDHVLPALAVALGTSTPRWAAEELEQAATDGHPLALELARLRARTVMTALGNTALAVKATGGAFVAGGIGVRLTRWLAEPEALARFYDRGVQTTLMRSIRIRLIRDERAPLLGAALLWRDFQMRGWR